MSNSQYGHKLNLQESENSTPSILQRVSSRILDMAVVYGLELLVVNYFNITDKVRIINTMESESIGSYSILHIDNIRLCSLLFLFFVYMPISEMLGGTIGKWILGLKTESASQKSRPSLASTFLKSALIAWPLLIILLLLKYGTVYSRGQYSHDLEMATGLLYITSILLPLISMLFSKPKRPFHDKMSGVLIKKRY